MTKKEAERISRLLKDIKIMEDGPDNIRKLHNNSEHGKIANIAIELYSELRNHYINELMSYPSLTPDTSKENS